MIRLFIADDHPLVRDGLKYVVASCADVKVVGEADDAQTLFAQLSQSSANVLLLDVSMPGPGILEVIRRAKSTAPHIRILVVSVHPERHYAQRVMQAGADGYLTKSHSSEVLPYAIRQIHAGKKFITPGLAQQLAESLSGNRDSRPPHEALSTREYEVLLLLGAGRTVDHIAHELGLSAKTVRTYRSRILEKTDLRNTAEIIFYVVSNGLVAEVGDSRSTHGLRRHSGSRRAALSSRIGRKART
jgi:two-component system invasion response regulator UvrY